MSFWSWLFNSPKPKPAPPPPPPPPVGFDIVVLDGTTPIEGATVTVDNGTTPFVQTTNKDGYCYFVVPASLVDTWVKVEARGYLEYRWGTIHPRDISYGHNILRLIPALPQKPRLVPSGQFLRLQTGGPFTAIEASDFALYQRYLNGEDITPVLIQRAFVGFNMLRVFGMYNGALGHFVPAEHADYFQRLPMFAALLDRYGFYLEFVAFADTTQIMASSGEQLAHWSQLCNALHPLSNVLLEAVNEANQPINRTDALSQLPKPDGILASHGSNGSDAWPVQPYWDYATFHISSARWVRGTGHNAMEIWPGPTLMNEGRRAPDTYQDPTLAKAAAAGAALLCAGSCFHSVRGKSSQLWDGVELDLAQAWVQGAKSVQLFCQIGPYRHRTDLEDTFQRSHDGRTYQRGTDDRCIVKIPQGGN